LIALLTLLSLAIPFSAVADEDDVPERTGLRPDAPAYAIRGSYWVGFMEFDAEAPSHPTSVTVWYPAVNPDNKAEDNGYAFDYFPDFGIFPIEGHAIQSAVPNTQDGPYPLIIISHGQDGTRLGYTYLSEHLASHGFVVMAMDHADNPGTAGTIPIYTTLFTRPQDISWEIDYAVSLSAIGGELERLINIDNIAVIGHSHGGYTALASAGAQLDFTWYSQFVDEPIICVMPADSGEGNFCTDILDHQQELSDLAGLDTIPDRLWPSWEDPRVNAIVGLAPAGGYFGPEGLKGLTIPTMLMVGSNDTGISAAVDVYQPCEQLNSENKRVVTFDAADHMIFFLTCSDGPWMIDMGAHSSCSDPVWDMDRAHDLVNHFTTAFLLDVLKGDKDAHIALLTENVSFPGITYETTMK
jgi:predicted dienelactone hydrolase